MKNTKKNEEKIIDATGKSLGRLASEVAMSLMGKNTVSFSRNTYSGLRVKVINASKLKITSKKLEEIRHTRYSGHRGGLRVLTGRETVTKKGFEELIKLAVFRMLPDNKLRREMMKNLKIED